MNEKDLSMHPDALDMNVDTDEISIEDRRIERGRFRDRMTVAGTASFERDEFREEVEVVDFDVYNKNFELSSYENDEPLDADMEINALTVFGGVDAMSFKKSFKPDLEYFEASFGVVNAFMMGLMDTSTMEWYSDVMGVLEHMKVMENELGGNIDVNSREYNKKWKELVKTHGREAVFGPRGVLNFILAFQRAKSAYGSLEALCIRELPENYEDAEDFGIYLHEGALRLQSGTIEDEESERFCRVASGTPADATGKTGKTRKRGGGGISEDTDEGEEEVEEDDEVVEDDEEKVEAMKKVAEELVKELEKVVRKMLKTLRLSKKEQNTVREGVLEKVRQGVKNALKSLEDVARNAGGVMGKTVEKAKRKAVAEKMIEGASQGAVMPEDIKKVLDNLVNEVKRIIAETIKLTGEKKGKAGAWGEEFSLDKYVEENVTPVINEYLGKFVKAHEGAFSDDTEEDDDEQVESAWR